MKKLTREQINMRLGILRGSRDDDESYFITRPEMAMCYSMHLRRMRKWIICNSCGNDFKITWTLGFDRETIKTAEGIVKQYQESGLEAKLICNCPECVQKKNVNPYEIWIKAFDESDWHISLPKIAYQYDQKEKYTSDFEYELVLKFLTVAEEFNNLPGFFDKLYNIEFRKSKLEFFVGTDLIEQQTFESNWKKWSDWDKKRLVVENPNLFYSGKPPIDFTAVNNLTVVQALCLIKNHICANGYDNYYIFNQFVDLFVRKCRSLSYKGLNGKRYVYHNDDAGFIKTQTDIALSKVLGLTIIYDKEEVRKNIACIFSQPKIGVSISKAYEMLEQCGKEIFTVWEYIEFMDSIFKKYKKHDESDGEE